MRTPADTQTYTAQSSLRPTSTRFRQFDSAFPCHKRFAEHALAADGAAAIPVAIPDISPDSSHLSEFTGVSTGSDLRADRKQRVLDFSCLHPFCSRDGQEKTLTY